MATRQKPRRSVRRGSKKAVPKRASGTRAVRARSNGRASSARVARSQPETLRLRGLTPTFTVDDLERSIAWYRDGLGFVVGETWEHGGKVHGVMLKAGACTVSLSQDDFGKGRDREKGVGFRIYAETAQDVDALADRARSHGCRIVSEPADVSWGARVFTVEDPDGFLISFSQER